jgi:flagellar basal body-associated protein FliL
METLNKLVIVMAITMGAVAIMFAVFCLSHSKNKKGRKEDSK